MQRLVSWVSVLCIPFCSGCDGWLNGTGSGALRPPTSADDVHADWTALGGFTFHEEGDDSTARTLIRDYGWEVFEGHDGGPGGTLQIVDPSGAVVLIWAHNLFNGFILRDGWTGQTANGARIGTTLSEFNELHSEFTETSPGRLHFGSGTTEVTVTFEEELLSEIDVREY